MEYLLLGKIIKPHGLKGEVKIFSHTDFASSRYKKDHVVFYLDNKEYKPLTVNSFFKYNLFDVVSFKEYPSIESVKELLGKEIFIKKEDASLPKNYYHYSSLIGCNVIENNKVIGKVIEVIDFPANFVIRCKNDKKKFDIPFVDEFILNVDINKKEIKVKLIEGIL